MKIDIYCRVFLAFALLIALVPASTTALSVLDPGSLSTRGLGVAGAHTAIADDSSAFSVNPAGLSRNAEYRRVFANSRFYKDFKHWGLNAGIIDGITEDPIHWGFRFDSTRTQELKRNQYVFASSYGFRNIILFGTNTRFHQFNRTSTITPRWIFGMDAGVLGFVADYLSIGFAAKNIVRSEPSSELAPFSFSLGAALNLQRYRIDIDVERNHSGQAFYFRGGGEFAVVPTVTLRAGYFQDRQRREYGYSVGATIKPDNRFALDVGFLDQLKSSYKVFLLGVSFTL